MKGETCLLLEAALRDNDSGVGETRLHELVRITTSPCEAKATVHHLNQTLRQSKSWRSVYKALHVMEYLLEHGSEQVQREVMAVGMEIAVLCAEDREEGKTQAVRMKAKLVYECICERVRREWKLEERDFYIEQSSLFAPEASFPGDIRRKPTLSAAKESKAADVAAPSPLFYRLHKCKSTVPPPSIDLLSLSTPQPSILVHTPISDLVFDPVLPQTLPSPKSAPQVHFNPPLPEIRHNMAVPQDPLPSIPPASKAGLDMTTLLSGLDSLKTEVESRRLANRKREVVINL